MNCPGKKTIAKNSKKIEIIVFNPLHVFCTYCLSNLRNKYCAQHFFFAMSALFRYSFFWRQKKTGKTKQVSRRQRASSLYTRASTNALRKLGRCKDDKREKKREKSIGKTHGKLQKKTKQNNRNSSFLRNNSFFTLQILLRTKEEGRKMRCKTLLTHFRTNPFLISVVRSIIFYIKGKIAFKR